ncbi:MAG: hypothetical protein ACREJC_21700 [Tepidisphaeraceae bacterium]
MNRLSSTFLILGLACAFGCQSSKKQESAQAPPPQGTAASPTVAEINTAKFMGAQAPQAVQSAFARDYPNAAIGSVQQRNTSVGTSFFSISFIRSGQSGIANYYPSGAPGPATP